jgi:hypothetical protein
VTNLLPPRHYPWWVRFMLLEASSRRALKFWGGMYLVAAAASALFGVLFEDDPTFGLIFAVVFVLLAVVHWLTIRWVDRHGSWSSHG